MLETPTKVSRSQPRTGAGSSGQPSLGDRVPLSPLSSVWPTADHRPAGEPTSRPTAAMLTTPHRPGPGGIHATPGTASRPAPPPGTFNSPISTPFIQRLNGLELQWRLRDAYRLVREKDENLILAAEIGQSLLQANEELKTAYEKVLIEQEALLRATQEAASAVEPNPATTSPPLDPTAPDSPTPNRATQERLDLLSTLVSELEHTNAELQIKADEAEQELKEKTRVHQRETSQLQQSLRNAAAETDRLVKLSTGLEEDKSRLARERGDLSRSLRQATQDGAKSEVLQARIDELEHALAAAQTGRSDLERALIDSHHELQDLQARCVEYQSELVEGQQVHAKYAESVQHTEELNRSLEEAQETITLLAAQVDELQTRVKLVGDVGGGPGGNDGPECEVKTLLGEVEDRRQALESQHETLNRRHKGLVRAHSLTVHQQERMRHHIHRLTQMSNQPSQEERLRRLEQILGQTQSEKQQLQRRVEHLERMRSESRFMEYYSAGMLGSGGEYGDEGGLGEDPFYGADEGYAGPTHSNCPDVDGDGEPLTGDGAKPGPDPPPGQTPRAQVQPPPEEALINYFQLRIEQLMGENDQLRDELRTCQMLKLSESEKLVQIESTLQERDQEAQTLRARFNQLKFDHDDLRLKLQHAALAQGGGGATAVVGEGQEEVGVDSAPSQMARLKAQLTATSALPSVPAALSAAAVVSAAAAGSRRNRRQTRQVSAQHGELLPLRPLKGLASRDNTIPLTNDPSYPANPPPATLVPVNLPMTPADDTVLAPAPAPTTPIKPPTPLLASIPISGPNSSIKGLPTLHLTTTHAQGDPPSLGSAKSTTSLRSLGGGGGSSSSTGGGDSNRNNGGLPFDALFTPPEPALNDDALLMPPPLPLYMTVSPTACQTDKPKITRAPKQTIAPTAAADASNCNQQ
ncbi:hypothetical protein IWQ60_001687 [Tieghemiomyces parasiticus]|uniref:Uncharacterized protein n=1 Tax=Tieghemiomyces parasiticus TaxID=78921 RepID=A0A9W8E1N6_9FUNG|nr:hypothetical protein IWQ60_001687 [Tieghemiomyces parasiticus]